MNYIRDESEVYRSHSASTHYKYRGRFWNDVKHEALVRYTMLTLIGVIQAIVAYSANFVTKSLNASKFDTVGDIMQKVSLCHMSYLLIVSWLMVHGLLLLGRSSLVVMVQYYLNLLIGFFHGTIHLVLLNNSHHKINSLCI